MQKSYAIEQLRLTAVELQALEATASVFKGFQKKHNIDKIDALKQTISEISDEVYKLIFF